MLHGHLQIIRRGNPNLGQLQDLGQGCNIFRVVDVKQRFHRLPSVIVTVELIL